MIYKIDFVCNILGVIITITFFTIIGCFIYYKFIVEEIEISKILKKDKYLKYIGIIFLSSIFFIMILNNYSDKLMRTEAISELNKIDIKKSKIFVNNSKIKTTSLINVLRNMTVQTNKIGGDFELKVLLSDNTKLINIILRRNPENKEKYWVFYPKYKSSTNYCVGEIETKLLNDYNQE